MVSQNDTPRKAVERASAALEEEKGSFAGSNIRISRRSDHLLERTLALDSIRIAVREDIVRQPAN